MSQFVLFITINLEPGTQADFMPIIEENAAASLRDEPGCSQFDVWLPHDGSEDVAYLYEVYDDDAAFAAHQATSHYKTFKETTGAMVNNMNVIKMKGWKNG